MKSRLSLFLLLALLLTSCGGSRASRAVDDLQKKNDELTQRVKSLEDNLFAAEKKLIQMQQAIQGINERVRDMEGVIDQVRTGRSQ